MVVYYFTFVFSVGAAAMARISRAMARDGLRAGDRTVSRPLAFVTGAILVSVAALRWRVGVDYVTYERLYERYKSFAWSGFSLTDEPGIQILSRVGSWIYDDSAMMFGLAAVITVGLTVWTIYRSTSFFGLAIAVYVLSTAWQASFNGVRQQLAAAILFAGHRYIIERRFRPYVAVVAIATMFHLSAMIGLLFYAVPRGRLRLSRAASLMALAIVALLAYDSIGSLFDWIKQDEISEGSYFLEKVNPLRLVVAFAPLLAYSLFTDKKRLTPAEFFCVNMIFVGAATMVAALGSAYVARFYGYFALYLPLGIPAMLKTRDRDLQQAILPLALGAYGVYWYFETATVSALSNFNWVFDR